MTEDTLSPFDAAQFRKVLGHFPTGVTIVTGMAGDDPAGFTIGSFTSVSLEPPLVGFLPMISSDTWQAMAPFGRFCVNVLRDDQADAVLALRQERRRRRPLRRRHVDPLADRLSRASRASAPGSTAPSSTRSSSATTS